MRVLLFSLAFVLPMVIYVFAGKFFLGLPYPKMRMFLGLIFLILSGLMFKNQRFVLSFLFLLIALTLTTGDRLFS